VKTLVENGLLTNDSDPHVPLIAPPIPVPSVNCQSLIGEQWVWLSASLTGSIGSPRHVRSVDAEIAQALLDVVARQVGRDVGVGRTAARRDGDQVVVAAAVVVTVGQRRRGAHKERHGAGRQRQRT
jgi:hypothetical protein